MKNKDADRLQTLRLLKASFLNAQKSSDGNDELSDEQVLQLLSTEAKKRKDAIAQFTSGGRADLATTEQAELAIIEAYLPAQLTDDEITAIIEQVVGGFDQPQFGAVMGQVMQAVKAAGSADGDRVRTLLQQRLSA
jgi:uncharacterized protein YqeY